MREGGRGVAPPSLRVRRASRIARHGLFARATTVLLAGEAGVFIALIALVIIFYLLNPAFLSATNIRAMLGAVAFVGIIGVGQTVLLVAGEFDLSVGAVAGLCAVISGWLMTSGHLPVLLGVLGGLGSGILLGLVNGLVVVRFGIPAFIATLGMLFIAQGLTQVITNGYPIYPLPGVVGDFGRAPALLGTGWAFVVLLVLLVIGDLALRRTTIGRLRQEPWPVCAQGRRSSGTASPAPESPSSRVCRKLLYDLRPFGIPQVTVIGAARQRWWAFSPGDGGYSTRIVYHIGTVLNALLAAWRSYRRPQPPALSSG